MKRPIKDAPKDGTPLLLYCEQQDKFYAPCIWSPAGEISENGFWLWWQMDPVYLTEVVHPSHFIILEDLK